MSYDALINALATLFVIVDPVSLAPIFLALTPGMSRLERRKVALRAAAIALTVLIGFTVAGGALLAVLGISLAAFRIAGGLLLFWTAYEMVFEQRQQRRAETVDTAVLQDNRTQVAAFPLALPLIAGPGAITAVMLLAAQHPGPLALAGLIGTVVVVIGASLAAMLLASEVDRLLGETGRGVVTRLLGVVLAALAVQFVIDGVVEVLRGAT